MERRLFQLILTLTLFFVAPVTLFSQAPLQQDQLRIMIWADLDPIPGLFEEDSEKDNQVKTEKSYEGMTLKEKTFHQLYDFAIDRSREVAPFLMGGMLNGWTFEYTPYDRARKVAEYWEFNEAEPFNAEINPITYNAPEVLEDRLVSWAYCNRTDSQKSKYEAWNSIVHPHIKGKGTGSVQDGFEGIKTACSEAVKNAVREYWRTLEKNKPKEVSGKVLLIRNPRIYIKEGQYVVDLDFFLETDRIVSYSHY